MNVTVMVTLYPPARLVATSDTKKGSESAGCAATPERERDGVGREGLGRPATRGVKAIAMEAPMSSAVVLTKRRQVVNAQRKSSHGLAGAWQGVRGRERGAFEMALHVE